MTDGRDVPGQPDAAAPAVGRPTTGAADPSGVSALVAAATGLLEVAAARAAPSKSPAAAPPSALRPDTQAAALARFSSEAQSLVKWLLTALAVTATAVFGAGPILKPSGLSWEDDAGRLIAAGLCAVAGIVGVGAIILSASRVFLPAVVDLDQLPETTRRKVQAQAARFFPVKLVDKTVAGFSAELRLKRQVYVRKVAEQLLRDHLRSDPGATAKARATAQSAYQAGATVELPLALYELELYEGKRDLIVAYAQAEAARATADTIKHTLWWAGPLAVVGGVGTVLLLTAGDGAATDEPDPVATTMTALDTPAAATLWDRLGLVACDVDAQADGPGTVPVVLLGGAGSPADPWRVQTVPLRPECLTRTFDVTRDVATVVVVQPQDVSVEYTPVATPTS